MTSGLLALTVFVATAVEMVEALTIVLAVVVAFAGAGAAVLGVAILRVIVHRPLSRVPENAMKLGVGVLLSSFGTFWVVEGLGVGWPGSELALLYVTAVYSAAAFLLVKLLSRTRRSRLGADAHDPPGGRGAAG